jgi:dUTPase
MHIATASTNFFRDQPIFIGTAVTPPSNSRFSWQSRLEMEIKEQISSLASKVIVTSPYRLQVCLSNGPLGQALIAYGKGKRVATFVLVAKSLVPYRQCSAARTSVAPRLSMRSGADTAICSKPLAR